MDGQANWVASNSALSLNFDGTNDVVIAGRGSPVTTNRITVSAWFRPQKTGRSDVITCWTDGTSSSQFDLLVGVTASKARFFIGDGTFRGTSDSVTTLATGAWYHLAGTYDGATLGLWVNGILETSSALATTMLTANLTPIRIGNNQNANGTAQGQADDLRIYNRALTPAEIKLLASRRGIGLTQGVGTRATYPTKFQIRIGGTWREADGYQNVGGVWKPAPPSIKMAGVWK